MSAHPLPQLPNEIAGLKFLAHDLLGSGSHGGDDLWGPVDKESWENSHDPLTTLQHAREEHLKSLAAKKEFREKLMATVAERQHYLSTPGWFRSTEGASRLGGVAFLSMEFGLSPSLPIYSGGLGILGGDYLKTASDLDVPFIGVGLYYRQGYFRQFIDDNGAQQESNPYNDSATMPIEPVNLPGGELAIELLDRKVIVHVWQATVGRVKLYLLDSSDPRNRLRDRCITTKLYGGGTVMRLMQEIFLGIGGWRVVKALHPEIEICHVNEGHAAFAVIERARHLALKHNLDFWQSLCATRAGNVFTTHTPVAAGFDKFPPALLRNYLQPYVEGLKGRSDAKLSVDDVLALGRANPDDQNEPFNMAFLALRCSATTIAVSRLHGEVSRQVIFQGLFPRRPPYEVPVIPVTNAVHIKTWESPDAGRVWTMVLGEDRWLSPPLDDGANALDPSVITDKDLWDMHRAGRERLMNMLRLHLARQLRERGADPKEAEKAFKNDPLIICWARRFATYKRPCLLLSDRERLDRLLFDDNRPVLIIIAGKAHPDDEDGKKLIKEWVALARQPSYRDRVIFLEDYDISIAQTLVQGCDVWLNTPRPPNEASGTSGMKVLVNGGLNLGLDGWWPEAYFPGAGWLIGDGTGSDADDAESLYKILENEVIPEFYELDDNKLPYKWIARMRESMGKLTPVYGGARMMKEYIDKAYLPLADKFRARQANNYDKAKALDAWFEKLRCNWCNLKIDNPTFTQSDAIRKLKVRVFLGEITPDSVCVELFADPAAKGGDVEIYPLVLKKNGANASSTGGWFTYTGEFPGTRSLDDYTVRIVPCHPDAVLPVELPLIFWHH